MNISQIMQEISAIAQAAVITAEQVAPAGTSGASKFAAANKAITDTINATSAGSAAYAVTKAAMATGNGAFVAVAAANAIETALSIFRTFNVFPKAAVVQSALPLAPQPPMPPAPAPGQG